MDWTLAGIDGREMRGVIKALDEQIVGGEVWR